MPLGEIEQAVKRLHQLRAEMGRGKLPFQVWGRFMGLPTVDEMRTHEAAGVTGMSLVLWRAFDDITLEEKRERLERCAERFLGKR